MRARSCALAVLLLACCRKDQGTAAQTTAPDGGAPPIVHTTDAGPVKARVTLEPAHPRLGDTLTLTLSVVAEPGVTLDMPPFGEALGRFSIVSFVPRSETTAQGGTRASQRYVLDAPMSGKQRVPPLRIEFTDRRQPADGGDAEHEVLTDEVAVDIAAVAPEGEAAANLRPLRAALPEGPPLSVSVGLLATLGLLLLAAGGFAWRGLRLRARRLHVRSAYEVALSRLRALEDRGLPPPEAVDAWYVELSGIVRRYIEDRYGLRAPELTTEEFLREVQRVHLPTQTIGRRHQDLLGAFLSTCDRVKFAGYRPGSAESKQALAEALRFLQDTAPSGPEAGPPKAPGPRADQEASHAA